LSDRGTPSVTTLSTWVDSAPLLRMYRKLTSTVPAWSLIVIGWSKVIFDARSNSVTVPFRTPNGPGSR